MDKVDVAFTYMYTHTHVYMMEYYLTIKKTEVLPFVTAWMDLQGIMLSEISGTEKDKYFMFSLICGT